MNFLNDFARFDLEEVVFHNATDRFLFCEIAYMKISTKNYFFKSYELKIVLIQQKTIRMKLKKKQVQMAQDFVTNFTLVRSIHSHIRPELPVKKMGKEV